MHTLLALVNKHRNCDKFEVNTQSVAYLAGNEPNPLPVWLTEKERVTVEFLQVQVLKLYQHKENL